MRKKPVGLMVLTATAVFALSTYGEIDWAEARIMGTAAGGKMFYAPSEEMNFTLTLENVKGELPSDAYFIDWTRTGDDGKKDGGRVPASLAEPLVICTSIAQPGFVKIEANVVTKDGKRGPENHCWEKRVFFPRRCGRRTGQAGGRD